MLVNSACLLLVRCIGTALLMLSNVNYFLYFFLGEMGLYLFQKVTRGDFLYWMPVDGFLGLIVSVLFRVFVKVITDYTGIVQFRASGELGGAYWTLNTLLTLAAPFAAIRICFSNATQVEGILFGRDTVTTVVGFLVGTWSIFFGIFLKLMKKEYRKTFFTFETGCTWAMRFFLEGNTDERRVKPLRIHRSKWKKIRPEMKQFVFSNWEKWEEEQPVFFTSMFKNSLDDDMIPASALRRMKLAGGGQRRRSSVADGIRAGHSRKPYNEGRGEAKSHASVVPTDGNPAVAAKALLSSPLAATGGCLTPPDATPSDTPSLLDSRGISPEKEA
jgi:hypothetical protein